MALRHPDLNFTRKLIALVLVSLWGKSCGWGLLLRRNRPIDLKVGICTNYGFIIYTQVVGLINTYLPLTVIVFVINVKQFTALRVG